MRAAVPVVIVGGGGHASDVLAVIEALNEVTPDAFAVVGYVDDERPDNRRLERRGLSYLGSIEEGLYGKHSAVIAIGSPHVRAAVAMRVAGVCDLAPALVHPSAVIAPRVTLEPGSVVLAGATVSAEVTLDELAHVSQLVAVGHDAILGKSCSVFPGASIGGEARIGAEALVGAGAVVLQGREIGSSAVVGAGATVVTSVPPHSVAMGTPARWTAHEDKTRGGRPESPR